MSNDEDKWAEIVADMPLFEGARGAQVLRTIYTNYLLTFEHHISQLPRVPSPSLGPSSAPEVGVRTEAAFVLPPPTKRLRGAGAGGGASDGAAGAGGGASSAADVNGGTHVLEGDDSDDDMSVDELGGFVIEASSVHPLAA